MENYSNCENMRCKPSMKKTTIELTNDQYFFLKEKALQLQKQNQNASIVSIIRCLIEKDRQEWHTTRPARREKSNDQP